jgi:hypothetical protein
VVTVMARYGHPPQLSLVGRPHADGGWVRGALIWTYCMKGPLIQWSFA